MNLKQRVQFYRQFHKLSKSGLPVTELCSPRFFPFFEKIATVQRQLSSGLSVHQSLKATHEFSDVELALIDAGETSGHLTEIFASLESQFNHKLNARETVRKKTMYPVGLLLFSCVALPAPQYIMGNISFIELLLRSLGVWVLFAAVAGFAIYFIHSTVTNPNWSKTNSLVIDRIPYFGRQILNRDLENYFSALSLLFAAGILPDRASQIALTTVDSGFVKDHFLLVSRNLQQGLSLEQSFAQIPFLSEEDHLLFRSSDVTGKYDENFVQITETYRELNRKNIERMATQIPKVIYICVLLYIGGNLILNQLDRIDKINEILGD